MNTIALHPDFYGLRPYKISWDAGMRFSSTPQWKKETVQAFANSHYLGQSVLIGTSRGGIFLYEVLNYIHENNLTPPLCALIYEAPIPRPMDLPDIPYLCIWNDYTPWGWRANEKTLTQRIMEYHNTSKLTGGLHSHFKRVPYFPYYGFGWDKGLNEKIISWIQFYGTRSHRSLL